MEVLLQSQTNFDFTQKVSELTTESISDKK